MKINSQEEYERVMSRIAIISKSEDPRDQPELVELRDAAQAWDAGRGGEVAGDDAKRSGYDRRHNPITAMFDRLNESEKKK
jgi:hypothetical protein